MCDGGLTAQRHDRRAEELRDSYLEVLLHPVVTSSQRLTCGTSEKVHVVGSADQC